MKTNEIVNAKARALVHYLVVCQESTKYKNLVLSDLCIKILCGIINEEHPKYGMAYQEVHENCKKLLRILGSSGIMSRFPELAKHTQSLSIAIAMEEDQLLEAV